jgi:hypothetical protein
VVRFPRELLTELQKSGWDVTRHAGEANHLAWYHEVWALESRRSPRGFTLFLTFLTDPQPGNPNPLWLIATSRRFPESAAEAEGEPSLALTPRWEQELPRFVAALDALRQARENPETAPAEYAEEMVRYFGQLHRGNPARWADGLRLAREWRRLVTSPAPAAEDVVRLVEELHASNDPGSRWHDLKNVATDWARRRGFYPRST